MINDVPSGIGFDIGEARQSVGLKIQDVSEKQKVEGNTSVSDEGLELVAEYCRKTVATVGGDGQTEYVLYKRADNEYEVHLYMFYEYMEKEAHKAYRASKEAYNLVMEYIDKNKLVEYQDREGLPICGGMEIIKFIKDGKVYRITNSNLMPDEYDIMYGLRDIIYMYVNSENELV